MVLLRSRTSMLFVWLVPVGGVVVRIIFVATARTLRPSRSSTAVTATRGPLPSEFHQLNRLNQFTKFNRLPRRLLLLWRRCRGGPGRGGEEPRDLGQFALGLFVSFVLPGPPRGLCGHRPWGQGGGELHRLTTITTTTSSQSVFGPSVLSVFFQQAMSQAANYEIHASITNQSLN